ncbi:MAG: hypothetical protein RL139_848 [Gemmatimonadota bacterium]
MIGARSLRWLVAGCLALGVGGCDGLLTSPLPMGRIRIEARGRHGEPLPGITALLYVGYRPMGYLRTDARGMVRYDDIPENVYGVYMILPEEYAGWDEVAGLPRRDLADGIRVMAGTDTTLRFEFLRRGAGTVVAYAIDEDSLPVSGRLVTLYRATGVVAEDTTDAAGRVLFANVPMGVYGVFTNAPPTFGVSASRGFVYRDNLIIDHEHREVVALPLPRCGGTLTTRVLDGTNAPVAGARLTLYRGPQFFRTGTTDANGELRWTRILCGEYGVFVAPPVGYQSPFARDTSYVDQLAITDLSTTTVTLRAFRRP